MRPEDAELAQLLKQFVPVRITNFKAVDMNRFRFDYDLTFAILMMDADGGTYARFGTRDARSETDRMSIAGLKRTMRAVLALHRSRRKSSGAPPPPQKPFTLADIPSFTRNQASKQECAHCHFANNFRFKELRAQKRFTRDLLFQYPLPENIGVTLDVDTNNRVKSVTPDSPAQRAGLRPGDTIVRADQTPVLTIADLQFALNTVPDAGTVTLLTEREGKRLPPATLQLPQGWRRTDISWRASQASIPPTVGFWGEALNETQKKERGIPADRMALRVTFLFPGAEWAKTRGDLRKEDLLIGLDGRQPESLEIRQFHSQFRLTHAVGDTATLTVLRGKERLEIKVPCLEVGDEA